MKRILLVIISLITVLSLFSCGKTDDAGDFTWKVEEGVLYISGNGKISDYVDEDGNMKSRPWESEIKNINYIEIERGITYVGAYAFAGLQNLYEIELPQGLNGIGDHSFERCILITEVDLPGNVETVGDCAFKSCYSLYEINIHNNIKRLGDEAFNNCYSLKNIKIADGIESMGKSVFTDSLGPKTIEFEGTKERWKELGGESLVGETDTVNCSDGVFGE